MKSKLMKTFSAALFLIMLLSVTPVFATYQTSTDWKMIEPGAGGAFFAIGAGPTGVVVAGSDLSGAYISYDNGATWENRGYAEGLIYQTHVSAVGFDPDDEDLIYVGTEYGMYKSDDQGHTFHPILSSNWNAANRTGTWQVVRDSSTYGSYLDPTASANNRLYWTAITFAPSNPDIGYAAAHSAYNTNDGMIFKTTDRGETWTPVKVFKNVLSGTTMTAFNEDKRIQKIVVDPTDPTKVYFLSQWDKFTRGKGLYSFGPQTSLYKSTDGGSTWSILNGGASNTVTYSSVTSKYAKYDNNGQQVINTLTNSGDYYDGTSTPVSFTEPVLNRDVLDFELDPVTPSTIYATKGYRGLRGLIPQGTYKSTDSGATWTKVDDLFGLLKVKAVNNNSAQTVIRRFDVNGWETAATVAARDYPQVWESANGGTTWTQKADKTDFTFGAIDPQWYTQASAYAKTIGGSMADPDDYYWGDYQWVYKSTDGGASFSTASSTKTTVSGSNWYNTTGISNVVSFSLKDSEADPNIIFTGNADIGLWRSLDNGRTWQVSNNASYTSDWGTYGGQAQAIALDPDRSNVVWAGMGGGYVDQILVKSTSTGEASSWSNSHSGLPLEQRGAAMQQGAALRGLSIDKTSSTTNRTLFVVADDNVYKSTNDGSSWSQVLDMTNGNPYNYNGLAGGKTDSDRQAATAVDPSNGNYVYAGNADGLFKSSTGGGSGSWTSVGLPEMVNIQKIVVSPQNPAHLYVAAFGTYKDANNVTQKRGLYYSPDRGATWEQILKDDNMRGVAVNPDNEDIIFAGSSSVYNSGGRVGTSKGALLTVNRGITWEPVNEGLSWPFVRDIEFNPDDPTQVFTVTPGTSHHIRTFNYNDYVLPDNIVFQDDFSGSDLLSARYSITSGTWDKTGGSLNATGTSGTLPSGTKNQITITDMPDLKNYWFYTRIRSNGTQTGPFARIYLRKTNTTSTVIQVDPSNIKAGSGTPTVTLKNQFNMFLANTDYDLKIVLNGTQLDVYYKLATDPTYTLAGSTTTVSSGAGGVSLYASYTYSFDNIVIKYAE